MKNTLRSVFVFLALFPLVCFSDRTVVCAPPQGTRIDYFLSNTMNLQNQTFLTGRDQVTGMQPTIVFSDNNKDVSFMIGDTSEVKSQQKKGNMQVIASSDDQISFAGLVNGAPVLATYYPKFGVLIYTQQSIWPGPNYQGARAAIFYSKCTPK